MDAKARRITNVFSGVAAVTAFVTQPIPAADELLVVPIQYALCLPLARARGVSVLDLPWRSIQKIIWYGAAARLGANLSLGLVPVLGAFSNSITAVALTEFLARWVDAYAADPAHPPPEVSMAALRALFARPAKTSGEDPAVAKADSPPISMYPPSHGSPSGP